MELRQLEYLVAVADEANFTRAAQRLHVAQPGVSAQIRQLERELGEALFDRSARTVRLTAVGEAVLARARTALAAVADARLVVDELTGLVRGRVAIGMVTNCGSLDLPELLADFHQEHPTVTITLSEANSDELLAALTDGRLDVTIVGLAAPAPPNVDIHLIADEPLTAAVAPTDPLADHDVVALADLRERALISLPRGTGLRSCLDIACAEAGFTPNIAFEASDPRILARLAARGLGVALLPRVSAIADPELHAVDIVRPTPRSQLALAWRTDAPTSPAARALVRHARRHIPQPKR